MQCCTATAWVLLLIASTVLPAQTVVGRWLSEDHTPGGMGRSLEFSMDGRVRLSQGITVGTQWKIQERKRNRYILQIIDPATGIRLHSLELEVGKGDKAQLTQTLLATGERSQMNFVSRGRQTDDPLFLGRWEFILEDLGIRAFYDYTEDGWMWLRAPVQSETGTYTIDGGRITPEWPSGYPAITHLLIEGPMLIAMTADGSRERFLRPKMAMTRTGPAPALPDGIELTMPTIKEGGGLVERHTYRHLESVGDVTDIRVGDFHPAPGEELGIAGDRGAVLMTSTGDLIATIPFAESLGRVEIVDVEGDGECEFMNRGGDAYSVGLVDHQGRTLWTYRSRVGANDMASGDLDGDGVLDFVVGLNGGGGVHRLDHHGDVLWERNDNNVWHLEILPLDDGTPRIIHTNTGPEIVWRDGLGEVIRQADFDCEPPAFSIYGSLGQAGPSQLVCYSETTETLRITDLGGGIERQLPISIPDSLVVRGAWAQPIRFEASGSTFDAVTLRLRRPYRGDQGALLLFDEEGKLVYKEIVDQLFSALAVIPARDGQSQRLLVGGSGRVWEYRWLGSRD